MKCRFYYYLGMVRPTGQDMTATGKIVCHSPQEEPCHPHRAPLEKHQGQSGRRWNQGRAGVGGFLVIPVGKARGEAGRGQAGWRRCGRPRGLRVVSRGLVPGLGC